MASGKTTLGRALARLLGREFIDLDFYISQRFHKSIPELFKEYGEEGFRDIEAAMLREAGEFEGTVMFPRKYGFYSESRASDFSRSFSRTNHQAPENSQNKASANRG